MSIPDVNIQIGDLYEETLMKYASGKLTKNGIIMSPEDALEYFKSKAIDEGFAEDTIDGSAEELICDLEEIEEQKFYEYKEEKWNSP